MPDPPPDMRSHDDENNPQRTCSVCGHRILHTTTRGPATSIAYPCGHHQPYISTGDETQ